MFNFLIVVAALAGIGGWVANIYKLATCGLELASVGMLEVMRVIGIFIAPLGGVLGFL